MLIGILGFDGQGLFLGISGDLHVFGLESANVKFELELLNSILFDNGVLASEGFDGRWMLVDEWAPD